MKINENFFRLKENYLFTEMERLIKKSGVKDPIRLGIGDVTEPVPKTVIDEMKKAVEEQGERETFKGYPPTFGYPFLRERISEYYKGLGAEISSNEIFISDGAKSDLRRVLDLFGKVKVLIPNPSYPPYVDDNVILGNEAEFLPAVKENGFLPLPDEKLSGRYLIYICSPGNPTGAAYDRQGLKKWVDFALNSGSVILFDGAYSRYVREESIPKTVYQIEGAKDCAIEINSLSKWASFTGVRCGWTVTPTSLKAEGRSLKKVFERLLSTTFNGVSYMVQRGAFSAFSKEGECEKSVRLYLENAEILRKTLQDLGFFTVDTSHSPYVYFECPKGFNSMEFFDYLLNKFEIVSTPGSGFGSLGEGYMRLSGFTSREKILTAKERLEGLNL